MACGTASRLACCLLLLGQSLVLARVQLVTDNPSPFVSSDPDDPQFIVSLFDDAATAATVVPEPASLRSIVMADASGKRFNCSIPSGPPPPSTALAAPEDVTDTGLQIVKSPFELLEALTALCLYHKDGLWTYEVCHRKHIRQFRKDNNGRKQEDFSCGQYLGDEQQTEAVLEDASSSGHAVKYVSHTFGGGAKCVLTGQPRTAEVRYTCARHFQENTVLSVREFPTCNYVVVVSTPFLCKHPQFVPQPEDVRLVSCVPLEQPPAATAPGALPSSPSAAKPTKKASLGAGEQQQEQQQQQQSASTQQEQLQQAAGNAAGSEAAEGAQQQPPEIGIELKRTKRKAAAAGAAGDSGPGGQAQQEQEQEEEDVNDTAGFVVEAYTEEEGEWEEQQQQQQPGEAGGGSAGAEAAAERGAARQPDLPAKPGQPARQEEL